MIKFQALMQAVHQSIHSAAQAVEQSGTKHINKFFDKIESQAPEDKTALQDALSTAINEGDQEKAKQLLDQINAMPKDDDMNSESNATYRPKMVSMEFPAQSSEGTDTHMVDVPLITLCPISSPRIKDVKFSTDLEVTADNNDELFVAFRQPQVISGDDATKKDATNTHIEINLVGHEPPEGLQKVIEGYERALRAQIPG